MLASRCVVVFPTFLGGRELFHSQLPFFLRGPSLVDHVPCPKDQLHRKVEQNESTAWSPKQHLRKVCTAFVFTRETSVRQANPFHGLGDTGGSGGGSDARLAARLYVRAMRQCDGGAEFG